MIKELPVKSIFVLLIILFFWYLFTFKITEVPPGINGDEAAIGYNAALVAKTAHDQSGRFLPLFVSAFDLTDWKQPVTFYSTVLGFKIFGPSFSVLRGVSVVFVLISGILIFLLSKEILGVRGAFASLLILLTIPSIMVQSHLALENIAPVPFAILWLWMLVRYQKTSLSKYLYLSAIFLGTGLFTYPGMRLIVPVYIALTISFIYYFNRKKKLKRITLETLKFLLIVLLFPIFMYSVKNQYPGAILAYNRPHDVQSYQELILPYISSFDLSFLFILGDSTPYHSTGRQGVFLLATLPIFALGLFKIAQKKNPMLIFILLTFLLTPLFFGLAASVHRGSRLLVLLPFYTVITSFGFLSIFNIRKNLIKILVVSIVILLVSINYADFVRDYWFEYPKRIKSEFAKPYQIVFEKAYTLSKSNKLDPFIQDDFRIQNPIAEDFFEQVYFPEKLKIWKIDEALPQNSVIIVSDYILSIKKNVNQIKMGEGDFGILINENK